MTERHDTRRRCRTLLPVLLCLAIFATIFVYVPFIEAQTVKEQEKQEKQAKETPIRPAEVKQGEFKTFAPVRDQKKTKIFGRVLKPDGEVADGIVFEFKGYPDGWSISSGGGVPRNGAFDVEVPANSSYIAAVFDKRNRYAAPLLNIKIEDEAPEGELVFQLEDGVPLTASFLDETTGKPISGLEIHLAQSVETEDDDLWIDFEKESDESGLFEAHVLPGEYIMSVDSQYLKQDIVRNGVYARKFTVEKDKPVKLEFRIPTPFSGTVFDSNGVPAKEQIVFVTPTELGRSDDDSQPSTFTKTDKNGIFRRIKPPVNAVVSVLERGNGQYFAWFGDELASRNEAEFRCVESVEVKGRLLDTKTKEPLVGQLFFYWKKNPKKPTQMAFMPDMGRTSKQGVFNIKLNPTLAYDLFVVHGRQSRHGGGPYYPRIDLANVMPESFESKTTIDLGDLLVDPAKAVGDVSSMHDDEHDEKMRALYRSVKRGEKKAVLQITVKEGGEAAREYIEKRQNEKPFDSFAIMFVDYMSIPKEDRDRWENSEDEVIRNATSEKVFIGIESRQRQATATLSELRGEKDSPWNVPKGDPSNQGDWKQTSGMVNPKILDNFLNDYLKKLGDSTAK